MPEYTADKTCLPALEREVYAFKRRGDLLMLALEYKLESRLSDYWRDFYTDLYHALDPVNDLPFLISQKDFPVSYYQNRWPKRLEAKYFEREFKKIMERKEGLYRTARELDVLVKHDFEILACLLSGHTWQEWLRHLEVVSYNIDDSNEIFLSIK